jgi:hypothetical protein
MVERGIDIGARRIEVPLASNPEGIDAIGFELVESRFTCLSGPIERRVVDGVEEAQALVRKRPPVQREPGAVNAKHVGHRSIVHRFTFRLRTLASIQTATACPVAADS